MFVEPGSQTQGTSLQGETNIMQQQGTSLQGEPSRDMPNQGTELQGDPPGFVSMQGTELQGDPPSLWSMQGTELQGAPAGFMNMQGTELQGDPPGLWTMQGTQLQGQSPQRAYRSLGDLNGARLAIAADPSNAVTMQDGELVARGYANTNALRGTQLVATAPDGRTFRVEITNAILTGRTQRIELSVDGIAPCAADQQGVFVPGSWDAGAAHVFDASVVTYSCMTGVIAKCVAWGYAPWIADEDVHAACTRLARADYCGNGTPWTMDGTQVNVFDRFGIAAPTTGDDMAFEAAWGSSGALCVSRTRYEIHNSDGALVLPSCFANLPRCSSLEDAGRFGAILANRSRLQPIDACETP